MPYIIIGSMSENMNFFPSGRDLIGMVFERRLTFLLLSHCKNEASFQNCIWGPFRASPILFGVRGLYGRGTSRYDTTGLTWSILELISSISVIWYLHLLHILILTFDFPCGVWWWLSSSIATWSVIGSSTLIATIHTFYRPVLEVYDQLVNLGLYQRNNGLWNIHHPIN